MPRAAIVATARTPIGKAHRGAFNNTSAPELAGHAIAAALAKTGIDPSLVEDVVMGAAVQQGTQSFNVARQGALRAGLPVTVPGQTIDRQCSSGLMAVATAAKQILFDSMDVAIGGGVESISLVQNEHYNKYRSRDSWLEANVPGTYMPMLRTAELVAERYGISREAQDQMAAASQQRAANAQASGRFDDEIAPIWVTTLKTDKESGEVSETEQLVSRDEGVRAGTTFETLSGLRTVLQPGEFTANPTVTAGNASQLSDGASANVLMNSDYAASLGLAPLGYYCGIAVTGCEPDEMGIGPVTAIPRLLKNHGLTVDDIGIWELNEAFASQAVYCRDILGIDPEKMNVNGGAIALGHPYGMTGSRAVGSALLEAPPPRCAVRGGFDVRGRRHGRRGPLRGRALSGLAKHRGNASGRFPRASCRGEPPAIVFHPLLQRGELRRGQPLHQRGERCRAVGRARGPGPCGRDGPRTVLLVRVRPDLDDPVGLPELQAPGQHERVVLAALPDRVRPGLAGGAKVGDLEVVVADLKDRPDGGGGRLLDEVERDDQLHHHPVDESARCRRPVRVLGGEGAPLGALGLVLVGPHVDHFALRLVRGAPESGQRRELGTVDVPGAEPPLELRHVLRIHLVGTDFVDHWHFLLVLVERVLGGGVAQPRRLSRPSSAATPAPAHSSSCSPVPPPTPQAPTRMPSLKIGTAPLA